MLPDAEAWPTRLGRRPGRPPGTAPPWVRDLVARVQRHLAGELQDFTAVPLDREPGVRLRPARLRGDPDVPAGQTRTYGDLAAMLGEPPGSEPGDRRRSWEPIPGR